MDKHISNKGFTLLEMCVVLLFISSFQIFFAMKQVDLLNTSHIFFDEYLFHQTEAMREAKTSDTITQNPQEVLHFNWRGNVNQARTIHFDDCDIVIELGGGRLVYR